MNINILDCTLRDGGYVNDFNFGIGTIKGILSKLFDAHTDVIECGFLKNGNYDLETTVFSDISQINALLPKTQNNNNSIFVAMIDCGTYDLSKLPHYSGKGISGIRVTFHYNKMHEGLAFCSEILKKGYKVFVQPMATTAYSDVEILTLVKMTNDLNPYALYLVDTFGTMRAKHLKHLFYLVDNNLNKDIAIGFHSHNNLQLSFSNAQELTRIRTPRKIIIDSSVHGLGRGAGNLHTELLASHINDEFFEKYNLTSYLEIIDEHFGSLLKNFKWGYSIPYYLAAENNCHPNYASFLMDRKTLTVKHINEILKLLPKSDKLLYRESVIAQLYNDYNAKQIDDSSALIELKKSLSQKKILLLAPGSSISEHRESIEQFIMVEKPIIISLNFETETYNTDYIFWGNEKRFAFASLSEVDLSKSIATSNILEAIGSAKYIVNYGNLAVFKGLAIDNTGLMALKLMLSLDAKKVFVAGLDGYKTNALNYKNEKMQHEYSPSQMRELNNAIAKELTELKTKHDIIFLTPSAYI